jgi:NAD(P)-dependent dehydrogenase (short-subunit alcohol dehydrogenase family)
MSGSSETLNVSPSPRNGARVAVVTGAASGIGHVISLRLLDAGLALVASDLSAPGLAGFGVISNG